MQLPEAVENPKAVRVKDTGAREIQTEKTLGYDGADLNHRRSVPEIDVQTCRVEVSFLKNNTIRNKKRRKKRTTTLGTWNVRTLLDNGKLYLLCRELTAQNIGITGICEHRWAGSGHFNCEDHLVIYSGAEKSGQSGVAMILDNEAKKGFISYNAISDRILTVHLNTKPVKTTIIQIYAPSTNHSEDEIEDFYSQL